jgi:hypothetical protein
MNHRINIDKYCIRNSGKNKGGGGFSRRGRTWLRNWTTATIRERKIDTI